MRTRRRVIRVTPLDLAGARVFGAALALAAAVLLAVALLHASGRLHAYVLMGDLRGMTTLPLYAGWLSDLGVLLWWSAASAAALAALCAPAADGTRGPSGERACLLAGAAITAWLALDDAWLLHERVLPRLGLEQRPLYALYALLVLGWLLRWRRVLLRLRPLRLGLALALFAVSVALDALPEALRPFGDAHVLVEDGAKWLGIVAWSLWMWSSSIAVLGDTDTRRRALDDGGDVLSDASAPADGG